MDLDTLAREIAALIEKSGHLDISSLTVTRTSCVGKKGWDVEIKSRCVLYPETA